MRDAAVKISALVSHQSYHLARNQRRTKLDALKPVMDGGSTSERT